MTSINIIHLYAKEMNIYGDNGNVLILQKRLQRSGIDVIITRVGVGESIPNDSHIIIGGGGQDAGQSAIASDLASKKNQLLAMRDDGVPMLMICGMYQMFGHYFKTLEGDVIEGVGLLDTYTEAGQKRIIGNIVNNSKHGDLIGYENHSGCTYVGSGSQPLGTTKLKQGNNGKDKTEGAVYNNVHATYLHGPVLAKAPKFLDYLISLALESAGINRVTDTLNDNLTSDAIVVAKSRPR